MTEVLGYIVLAAVAFGAFVYPGWQEVRDAFRHHAVAREVADARESTTHHDPSRPGVRVLRPRLRALGDRRAERPVSPLLAVHEAESRLAVGRDYEPAPHVARLLAFRRELAARGKSLDDLRIE